MGGASGSKLVSPMPGLLEKLHVKPGDKVKQGDAVAVIIGKILKAFIENILLIGYF